MMISRSYPGHSTHDCIILFTDGEANCGIWDDAPLLISEYRQRMELYKENGRINNVQLAAITIDTYEPTLLSKVSLNLNLFLSKTPILFLQREERFKIYLGS